MVGRIPVNDIEIVGPIPGGQRRWSPVQLAAGLGRRVGLVNLGHVGLNGAKVPVNPANKRLVDDIGGNDVVFGVFSSGGDNGGDDGVFDVDLAMHVSSRIPIHPHAALFLFWGHSYYIVVHLDIQDVILDEIVGGGIAALAHVNVPFFVIGLAR